MAAYYILTQPRRISDVILISCSHDPPASAAFSKSYQCAPPQPAISYSHICSFLCPAGEDAVEDEAEENPIALEFQQDREAFYIKDPKKALQGFFDREGM